MGNHLCLSRSVHPSFTFVNNFNRLIGAVKTYEGLLACRFFLGLVEGNVDCAIFSQIRVIHLSRRALPWNYTVFVIILQAAQHAAPVCCNVQCYISGRSLFWASCSSNSEHEWLAKLTRMVMDIHSGELILKGLQIFNNMQLLGGCFYQFLWFTKHFSASWQYSRYSILVRDRKNTLSHGVDPRLEWR